MLKILQEIVRGIFSPVTGLMFFTGGFVVCLFGYILHADSGAFLEAICAILGVFICAGDLYKMERKRSRFVLELDKFHSGGFVPSVGQPPKQVRGWGVCKKCGVAYESWSEPPHEHCK